MPGHGLIGRGRVIHKPARVSAVSPSIERVFEHGAVTDPLSDAEVEAEFAALIERAARERAVPEPFAGLRGAPGAGSALAIERLTAQGALADRPDTAVLDALRAARRLESWAQARQLVVIAELAARRSPPGPAAHVPSQLPGESPRESPLAFRAVADEIALELSVSATRPSSGSTSR